MEPLLIYGDSRVKTNLQTLQIILAPCNYKHKFKNGLTGLETELPLSEQCIHDESEQLAYVGDFVKLRVLHN